jgi:hypothetical protein
VTRQAPPRRITDPNFAGVPAVEFTYARSDSKEDECARGDLNTEAPHVGQ